MYWQCDMNKQWVLSQSKVYIYYICMYMYIKAYMHCTHTHTEIFHVHIHREQEREKLGLAMAAMAGFPEIPLPSWTSSNLFSACWIECRGQWWPTLFCKMWLLDVIFPFHNLQALSSAAKMARKAHKDLQLFAVPLVRVMQSLGELADDESYVATWRRRAYGENLQWRMTNPAWILWPRKSTDWIIEHHDRWSLVSHRPNQAR